MSLQHRPRQRLEVQLLQQLELLMLHRPQECSAANAA